MLPSDHDALRAALTTQFNSLSHAATGAAQISLVLEELSKATNNILADLASKWNYTHNVLCRMPVEVLAMCFTSLQLDLCDAMAVSHVSRPWRAIALAHRALWSNIEMKKCSRRALALLQMLFSRTGQYPVDFSGPSELTKDAVGPLASCLAEHMCHLRRIDCTGLTLKGFDLPLRLPAPLLENIWGDFDLVIPPNFLGGQAARLKLLSVSMVCFPAACSALSTLRYLNIEPFSRGAIHRTYAASFGRIFELCPRLERLYFTGMRIEDEDFVPTTPAPPTLRKINLVTRDPNYDIIQHYVDWKSGRNLRNVRLVMDKTTFLGCRIKNIVSGCTKLAITEWRNIKSITAFGPDANIKRTLESEYCGGYSRIAKLLLRGKSALCRVESLEVSVDAVDKSISHGVFAQALPKLTHLALEFGNFSDYDFGWDPLAVLLNHASDACPRLALVVLHFTLLARPLTVDDARELLVALERNTPRLPDISINGNLSAGVLEAQIPALEGCRIEFRVAGAETDSETETDDE